MKIRFRRPDTLGPDEREQLHAVMCTGARITREVFEAALDDSDEVFIVYEGGLICGFGCIGILTPRYRGRRHTLIMTGRVFITPQLRGRAVVLRSGFRAFLRCKLRAPWRRTYWCYGAATVSSYLLPARNFVDFWPRRNAPWPERERTLMAAVAAQTTAGTVDLGTGVMLQDKVLYHAQRRPLTPEQRADPDVAFFLERNPHSARGDALMCLAPLSIRNWTRAALRQLGALDWLAAKARLALRFLINPS